MSTLTVRLPDDKHEKLKALAEFDSETRFRALASQGSTKKGLNILKKLDSHFEG